jgi:hypothetical protein
MRLARAGVGSVSYWIELPITEVLLNMIELADQLEKEHEAAERAARQK